MRRIDREIELLTIRLTTCRLEEFSAVQSELFSLQKRREHLDELRTKRLKDKPK